MKSGRDQKLRELASSARIEAERRIGQARALVAAARDELAPLAGSPVFHNGMQAGARELTQRLEALDEPIQSLRAVLERHYRGATGP